MHYRITIMREFGKNEVLATVPYAEEDSWICLQRAYNIAQLLAHDIFGKANCQERLMRFQLYPKYYACTRTGQAIFVE